MTVWTAGFAVHPIAAATTLEVSDAGRIVVDATMRSLSHPDVYAVGDAALAEGAGGKPLRMACATASPMAWQAADALAARLTGRKVPETTIGYVTQCVSLGRRDGILQKVTPEDEATSTVLTGRAGCPRQGTHLRGRGLERLAPDADAAEPPPPPRPGPRPGGSSHHHLTGQRLADAARVQQDVGRLAGPDGRGGARGEGRDRRRALGQQQELVRRVLAVRADQVAQQGP